MKNKAFNGFKHVIIQPLHGITPPPPPQTGLFTIGSSGRPSPSKGFDILLKALAELKARGHVFKCRIAGCAKTDFADLVDRFDLENEVEFLGWITDKASFYQSLNLYVSASRIEPFGLTLIEAMMARRPVIATQCQGPSEFLADGSGILVPREDELSLANAIETMIENKTAREKQATAGYKKAMKCFNKDHLPEQLQTLLDQLPA